MKYYNLLLMACLLLSCKESDSGQDNPMANKRILTVVPATSQDLKTPAPMYSLQWKFSKQGTIRWKSDIEIQEQQTQRL